MASEEKLKWKIFLDTSHLKDGEITAKKSFNKMAREAKKLMTPLEKLESDQLELNEAYEAGVISSEQYAFSLERIHDKMAKLDKSSVESVEKVSKLSKAWNKFGGAISAIGIAGTVAAIAGLGRSMVSIIKEQGQAIADFERFGLNAAENMRKYKAAAADSKIELEELVDANKNLSIRIGEAVQDKGVGEQADIFRKLGLDFEKLAKQKPDEQIAAYGKAIQDLLDKGEFNEVITILDIQLGDSGTKTREAILKLAKDGTDAYDKLTASIKSSAHAIKEAETAFDELKRTAAGELAPAIEAGSKSLTALMTAGEPGKPSFGEVVGAMAGAVNSDGKTGLEVGELASRLGYETVGAASASGTGLDVEKFRKQATKEVLGTSRIMAGRTPSRDQAAQIQTLTFKLLEQAKEADKERIKTAQAAQDKLAKEQRRKEIKQADGLKLAELQKNLTENFLPRMGTRKSKQNLKGLGRAGENVLSGLSGVGGFFSGIPGRINKGNEAMKQAAQYQEWLKGKDGPGFKSTMRGPLSSMGAGSTAAFSMLQKKQVKVIDPAQKTRGEILEQQKKQSAALTKIKDEIVGGKFKPGAGFTFANLNEGG